MHSIINTPVITLVGAPNAGKTTLYNWITGSRSHAVNYPGSTVEYICGKSLDLYGPSLVVLDTPGTYSLFPKTLEEGVTRNVLFKTTEYSPSLVIAAVDSLQFSRHMLLVKQLLEAKFQVIVALTMTDVLKNEGKNINIEYLKKELSIPVFVIDGRLGGGIKDLMETVQKLSSSPQETPSPLQEWSNERYEKEFHLLKKLYNKILIKDDLPHTTSQDRTRKIDHWLLHPYLGFFFFFITMGLIFTSVFALAQPLMDLIDTSLSWLTTALLKGHDYSLFRDFFANGIVTGFGAFLVFIPQIFILHFGLTLLEDSGYLARLATIMDKPLSLIGLNGRCFVPMLSAFACAVPAIMATRTIPSQKERRLTMLILPLMTCSARLPVYALLLAFLFLNKPAWMAGIALALVYFGSLLLGAMVSMILSRAIKADQLSFFMLELPHYRLPRMRNVIRLAWNQTTSFTLRAGPIIFVISLLTWSLTTFPKYDITDKSERIKQSYLAYAGQAIEPVMAPMGLDWRTGVGIISSFAAREVFVSTLAIMFNVTENDDDKHMQASLLGAMSDAKNSEGKPLFTPSSIIGLFVFFMLALQCMATIAVVKKETGSWSFALLQLVVLTGAGYLAAVGIVTGLRSMGLS